MLGEVAPPDRFRLRPGGIPHRPADAQRLPGGPGPGNPQGPSCDPASRRLRRPPGPDPLQGRRPLRLRSPHQPRQAHRPPSGGSPPTRGRRRVRSIAWRDRERPEVGNLRATTRSACAALSRSDSALGAVRAFRPPAASSLCVRSFSLDQAQSLRAQAPASRGSSCMPMQLKAMAGCRQRWLCQQFRWSAVSHRVPNRWLLAPDLAPRSSLAILVGPRRPAQRPRPPLPLRGEPRSPASGACSPLHLDGDFRGKPCTPKVARLKQVWRLLTSQSINLRYRRTPVFRCRSR